MEERDLIEKAIAFLKCEYGEDTVRMDIVRNGVEGGRGVLEVGCTVSVGGMRSDWTKWFTFECGDVVSMRWKIR